MKYAIISDVHANLEALQVVLSEIKNVDKIICLGDIVGYGPDPIGCCKIIQEIAAVCIAGNHDLAAIGNYSIEYFNPYAKEAIIWTQKNLGEEYKEFLRKQREKEILSSFTIVHGALTSPASDYILTTQDARDNFELLTTPILFIGHSHIAECYLKKRETFFCERFSLFSGGIIKIKEDFQYIINVGSVGQPRDSNPLVSFCIYDEDEKIIKIKRIDYPRERTIKKMQEKNLPQFLWQRLLIGR